MMLILVLSGYLHQSITQSLIEDDRYNNAVAQTMAIAERIAAGQLFKSPDVLQAHILGVTDARRTFKQIDVYQTGPTGLRLSATTGPAGERLPALDEHSPDNELGEMEHPLPEVVTMEVVRQNARHWLISIAIHGQDADGYVSALVVKNPFSPLVRQLQIRDNLVMGGAIAVCVALLYLMFNYFFRRPARDIINAMTHPGDRSLAARAEVRRDDELGAIARGFNAMMDDLSARDREREALLTRIKDFNRELHAKVESATSDLRRANDALLKSQQQLARADRLAAIGQVAASLAHEIGTPLNSISGHLQLLARRRPQDTEAQRRFAIISQQLDSIVDTVSSLLQRTHKRQPTMRPTDLNLLVGELLRFTGPTLESHEITVEINLDPALPRVCADGDGLHHVFLNLINNSIDAMPHGGRLAIQTRLDESTQVAEVTVRDTGSGIPTDALEYLFEPLWTTKPTGSGFGLAIAREIMTEHGGDIDAESAPEGGAVFRLRLPLAGQIAMA